MPYPSVATFNQPRGLAFFGNALYVVSAGDSKIRRVSPTGQGSTFAGSGTVGFADGTGTAASFYTPYALTFAPDGTLYVAE